MPSAGESTGDLLARRRDSKVPCIASQDQDATFLQEVGGPGEDLKQPADPLQRGADVNSFDEETGRNALSFACRTGLTTIVQRLLENGADANKPDSRGWLPIEHAAYHGHMEIVGLLEHRASIDGDLCSRPRLRAAPNVSTIKETNAHVPWLREQHLPAGGSHLWISLGSNDATNATHTHPICFLGNSVDTLEKQAGYSVSVHAHGNQEPTYSATLPGLGTNVNEPWYFPVKDMSKAQLIWELYKNESHCQKRPVGSSIVLLSELSSRTRPLKESLIRDLTIPLQDPSTLECIAKLTVSIFTATPYSAPRPSLVPRPWSFGNGIGGHRGSGKNQIGSKRLQIGENSLQSFTSAVKHGAAFLEFDVQLTSDLVPVIYHDLLVSETGTDSPMHTLTFEQFQQLSKSQGPRPRKLARSNSLHSVDHDYLDDLSDRMTKTKFNSINGFKSNTRGNFIRESCCTLEDVLKSVPPRINLNIELKYPMLFEANEWDMEPLAIKTDVVVDTILSKVYEHALERTIVFSSFSPEICITLSAKQRTWPVFFLSKTSAPRGEVRSSCIQQAVEFAKSWGLPGIVVECTPLVNCPRLIEYVKSAGLAIMSFGVLNSEPECAKVQFDGGINAVITDRVRAVARLSNLPGASSESVRVFP